MQQQLQLHAMVTTQEKPRGLQNTGGRFGREGQWCGCWWPLGPSHAGHRRQGHGGTWKWGMLAADGKKNVFFSCWFFGFTLSFYKFISVIVWKEAVCFVVMYHEWYGLRPGEKSGWGEWGNDAVFANIICQASTIRLEVRRYCAGWTCNSMNKFGVRRSCLWFMVFNDFFTAMVVFPLTCQPDGHFWLGHPYLLNHPFVSVPWQGPNIPAGGPTAPSKSPNLLPPPNFQVQGKGGTLRSRDAKGRGGNKGLADWRVGRKAVVGLIVGRAKFSLVSLKPSLYGGRWGMRSPMILIFGRSKLDARIFVSFLWWFAWPQSSWHFTFKVWTAQNYRGNVNHWSCEIEKWIRQLYCRVVKQINRIPTIVPEKCRKDGRHVAFLCEITRGRNLSMINRVTPNDVSVSRTRPVAGPGQGPQLGSWQKSVRGIWASSRNSASSLLEM